MASFTCSSTGQTSGEAVFSGATAKDRPWKVTIYLEGVAKRTDSFVAGQTPGTSTATFSGLTMGKSYTTSYIVRYTDGAEETIASGSCSFTTDPPDNPTSVSASTTSSSITFSWSATGVDHYEISWSGAESDSNNNYTSTSKTISGLNAGDSITMNVTSCGPDDCDTGSTSKTETVPTPSDTTPPTDPSVKNDGAGDNYIWVEWYECFDNPGGSGMSHYTIQFREGSSSGTIVINDNNVQYYDGQTGIYNTYDDGGVWLEPNTYYWIRIGAVDNAGNTSYGYWGATTDKESLSMPTLSTSSTLTKITATCGPVANADSYTFTCSGQPSQNRTTAGSVTFTGLTPDVTYTVCVKAEGSGDYSDSSSRCVSTSTQTLGFDWTAAEESLFNNNGDVQDLPYTRWNDMVDAINLLREDNGLADVSAYISSGDKTLYAATFNLALNGLEAVKGTIMSDVSSGDPVLGQYFLDLRDAILATG